MTRARIAVVDDSEQMLDLLAELLGMSGFEVTTLNGDERSIDGLVAAEPDAIVLDLVLTGSGHRLSGWDFLRLVRSHPRLNAQYALDLPIPAAASVASGEREGANEAARLDAPRRESR